mmetsp:Transcript_44812/g.74370  ORF Transcript_44812/g.74370 Transcript_44812/m.74370 type:complete len:95 (-) Transcript_44812:566-850(-)
MVQQQIRANSVRLSSHHLMPFILPRASLDLPGQSFSASQHGCSFCPPSEPRHENGTIDLLPRQLLKIFISQLEENTFSVPSRVCEQQLCDTRRT